MVRSALPRGYCLVSSRLGKCLFVTKARIERLQFEFFDDRSAFFNHQRQVPFPVLECEREFDLVARDFVDLGVTGPLKEALIAERVKVEGGALLHAFLAFVAFQCFFVQLGLPFFLLQRHSRCVVLFSCLEFG